MTLGWKVLPRVMRMRIQMMSDEMDLNEMACLLAGEM